MKQHLQPFGRLLAALNTDLQGGAGVRVVLWLALVFIPLCPALSAENNQVILTNAGQVLSMRPGQADRGNTTVRIHGLVTYYEPGVLLFVQDETAGAFVYHTGEPLALHAGQYVEVTGVAAPGLYSPIIASPKIRPAKGGQAIVPRPVSLSEIDLGGLDAQWVEFTGVVRAVRTDPDRFGLDLAVPPHRITVWVAKHEGYEQMRLVGSYARVRGVVAGIFTNKELLVGFKVLANSLSDVATLREAPENPFTLPLLAIRDLRGQQARKLIPEQVHTRGIVTLCWPGRSLFIQDSDGGLEVQAGESTNELRPGDAVEVVGFPGPVLAAPVLEDALIRKLATEPVPKAVHLSTEDLFRGSHSSELVETEADLTSTDSSSNLWTFALQGHNHTLTALLPATSSAPGFTAIRPGSWLRLTGVCVREEALAETQPRIRLLLRSPSDIAVIASAQPLPRPSVAAASVIAIVATVLLLLASWYIAQQHARTKHILQTQTSLQAEMHQNVQQLRRSMEERERIGRDLHDDIIQSIYAVGLNLEDCRRVVRNSPDLAEGRLTSAIQTLNSSIRHVRGFLAGLEPKVFNGREFKTALKSLALTNSDDPTQFQLEVDSTAANRLTPAQATQLLHIAKEAMSNSLRHAHASTLVVSLLPTSAGLRLEVFDNGDGFNTQALDAKGHGLRNMTARAREIGADLQIVSAVGQGCRILVNVPQHNANGHG